jgi:hypothetical protein
METVNHQYLYMSCVNDNTNEDEFFVEIFSYEDDGTSKPAAVTKNFDDLIDFLEKQYEE